MVELSILKQHEWPGNIRELKNVIERAVISTTGNRLRLDLALPNTPTVEQSSSESTPVVPSDYRTVSEFKELEKANLIAALTHANWKT